MSRTAIVEFQHHGGCTVGQPYGNCDPRCGWEIKKFVDELKAGRISRVSQKITEDWETEIRNLPMAGILMAEIRYPKTPSHPQSYLFKTYLLLT